MAGTPPSADAHAIVRRTGWVIVVLGVAESLYGWLSAPPGAISINCLGLLTGLAILAGNPRMVAGVCWLAWVELAPLAWMLVAPLVLAPFGLLLAQLRVEPGVVAAHYLPLTITLAALIFITRQLGRPAVLAAQAAAGDPLREMRIPAALGLVLALGLAWFAYRALHSDDAQVAAQRAAERYGPGYQYFVRQISYPGDVDHHAARAQIDAWNARQVLHVVEAWAN